MKRALRLILIALVLLISMQIPASADSLQDNLVPQDQETKTIGSVDLAYNEYPMHHYELDTYVDTSGDWLPSNWMDGAGKQIYIALMEIINSIWQLNVVLSTFTMVIVQEAFELDFVSGVVDEVGASIQNVAGFNSQGFMSNGLWPIMLTTIFCIVGAWATYVGMIKRESSRAWGGLISALIVFVLSLGFFSNAGTVLGGLNSWSSDIQSKILGVSSSIVNPGASYTAEEGMASVRNQMFDLMVNKPYMLMQYGTTNIEKERVDDLLSVDPVFEGEEREEKAQVEVNEFDNAMMSIDGVTQRAAFVPLLFIGNSIIGVFLLIISGSIILFQMIFLVLALFAPVPLLMAIVPRWQQTAVDWFMKLLHAQLMKIGIALLLTILFGISAILYRATESSDLGYLGIMVLQIICFVGIWAKRKELFGMVSTAASSVQSSTGQTLQNYKQRYHQARNTMNQLNRRTGRDGSQNTRNQTLANRNQHYKGPSMDPHQSNQEQLANRTNRPGHAMNQEAHLRGEADSSKVKGQHHLTADKPAPDESQLSERMPDTEGNEKQKDSNVTNIEDLRKRRLERGTAANAPLVDRRSQSKAQRESAASLEGPDHPEGQSTRSKSERTIDLKNTHAHRDTINDRSDQQVEETHNMEDNRKREVTSRQKLNHETKGKHRTDQVNRTEETIENHEKSTHKVSERNHQVSETERTVQDQRINRESINHRVLDRNEKKINLKRDQVNVSKVIEHVKSHDKPLTKWEADQQVKAKRMKK
ncbi:conjugal transfer protein [Rossellomorea marisflavi]|uniref:Conjugal transfer protein n=1 Tax=Rossellomorea marisflavi TaxID=189381 RepID=A0A5D4R9V6_9BACI|nr:CidA/LrgA family protein [Rossellomorea marisflavi]TYS48253.1 conjugal transfer protein [Rossellomorea marisflavi]